jgi:hypothetical protein
VCELANIVLYKSKVKPPTKFTNNQHMSATSGNKRPRDNMVKQEKKDDQPDQNQDQQLQDQQLQDQQLQDQQLQPQLVEHQPWDTTRTRLRGDSIAKHIREFERAFHLSGPNIPIVLHFTITEWASAFKAKLLEHHVDEHSTKTQISASLIHCLARWAVNVAATGTAQSLDVTERWLVEPYVTEAVRLGYFEDQQKTIEKILRAMHNLPAPA